MLDPVQILSTLRHGDPKLKSVKASSLLPARALAVALAESADTKVLILNGMSQYKESEVCEIFEALSCNDQLRILDVSDMRLSEECIFHVADLVRHSRSLHRLDLSGNAVSEDAAAELGAALRHHPSLRALIMRDCSLRDAGLEAFLEELGDGCTQHKFDLSQNGISLRGSEALARFVQSSTELTNVMLANGNALSAAQAESIARSTKRNIARFGCEPSSRPASMLQSRQQATRAQFPELSTLMRCEETRLPNIDFLTCLS